MSRSAVIYARQSEDVSEGIARQLDRCRSLISARGWTVTAEYADNDTSASKDRSNGTRWADMLTDAKAGRFDVVVSVDLDRLLRGITDLSALIDSGVQVLTVDGEIDLTTADGEFRATMLAGIARFEVRRKSERQKRAYDAKAQRGEPIAGGRRRFGYESDRVTPRESEAVWVRYMFEQAHAGSSLRGIAARMNEGGSVTADGLTWSSGKVRRILTNPAYAGNVMRNGVAHPSDLVPVLADRQVVAEVQAALADPNRRTDVEGGRTELLSGIALCGTCGAKMTTAGVKQNGTPIGLYRCLEKGGGVKHPAIRRALADEEVLYFTFLRMLAFEPSDFEQPDDGSAPVLARLAELDRKRSVVQELAMMDGADLSDTRRRLSELKTERDAAQIELDAIRSRNVRANIRAVLEEAELIELAKDGTGMPELLEAYERFRAVFDALDIEQRRSLIASTVSVTIDVGYGTQRVQVTEV